MQVPRSEMAKHYYLVYVGRVPGVYDHWPATQAQAHRYQGASYRGFDTRAKAEISYLRWSTLQHEQGRHRRYYIVALVFMLIALLFYIML